MVYGSDCAVVIRGRRGRNLLLQTQGVNLRLVVQAAAEVATVLEGNTQGNADHIEATVGQPTASLSSGHLKVLGSRLNATYRLVGHVLVIVLTRAQDNAFASLALANAVTRLLVVECKTVDVAPDRIERRYAQVYLSVEALLARGSLDVVQAVIDSNAVLDGLTPEGARRAKNAKLAAQQAAAAKGPPKPVTRKLADLRGGAPRLSFLTPPEVTNFNVSLPAYPLPSLPAPDRPPFKAAAAETLPMLMDDAEVADQGEVADGEPEAGAPAAMRLPTGPSLRLVELHRQEVVGSRITRAGLAGHVRWASQEARTLSGSSPFRLQLPEFPEAQLRASLKCAAVAARGAKHGPEWGAFTAEPFGSLPIAAPLLRYQLPASYTSPPAPLLASLSAGVVPLRGGKDGKGKAGAAAGGGAAAVLVTIQYAVSSDVGRDFRDLAVDLVVPPAFGVPRRVSPPNSHWGRSQARMRWLFGGVYPGLAGTCLAAFRVPGGEEEARAGLAATHAVLRLRGVPGESLTGMSLMQSQSTVVPVQPHPETAEWQAWVLARPAC